MLSLRTALLLCVPLLSLCSAHGQQASNADEQDDTGIPLDQLVEWLPEESIKSALLEHPKYRDGVFEHKKQAFERIRNESPDLATRLVDQALHREIEKQDLRKRASTNVTESTTPSPSSSSALLPVLTQTTTIFAAGSTIIEVIIGGVTSTQSVIVGSTTSKQSPTPTTSKSSGGGQTSGGGHTTSASSGGGGGGSSPNSPASPASSATKTGVVVPVTVTSTDGSGRTVVKTTSAFQSSADTSIVVPTTTTNAQGQTITTSATVPAQRVTTTNAQGSTITTASPVSTVKVGNGGSIVQQGPETTTDQYGNTVVITGTRAGQVVTATDAAGRRVVVTYHPNGGQISEVVVRTTRLPNGQQSTYTSFAVVGGNPHATVGSDSNSGSRGKPGLQSGVGPLTGRYVGEVAALFGGAVGAAAILL